MDKKILPWHIDRYKYCQLSLTDDRRQFITLGVHLCVQHNGCDAARRVGPFAAPKT